MIKHTTLDYHVTNLTRSLDNSDGQIKPLTRTLYSDPNPNRNPNHNQTLKRNLTYFLIWPRHVMLRDQGSFLLPITCQGSFLTLCHVGDSEFVYKITLLAGNVRVSLYKLNSESAFKNSSFEHNYNCRGHF